MSRVHLQLSEAQIRVLREQAEASGRPLAAVVREAIDDWIANRQRSARVDRALSAIGGFHSGVGDLAENHDRYLAE